MNVAAITRGDLELDLAMPCVRVPDSISKNTKATALELRPELVQALKAFRPELTQPFEKAFFGKVPNMVTFKRDLTKAQILPVYEHGRRVDFHALRTTFGSHLQASGVSPRAAMEIMRHSDMKLTMRTYTDARLLPLTSEMAKLPSFKLPDLHTQVHAHAGAVSSQNESQADVSSLLLASAQPSGSVAFRRTETPSEPSRRPSTLVDPIRVRLLP